MDKTILVDKNIEDGKALIQALDAKSLAIKAALWLFSSENNEWRLVIASPYVDKNGPRETYKFIQKTLKALPEVSLSLNDIFVMSPKNKLIELISTAIHTGNKIEGIRFTNNVIDNTLIEDAFIYRAS